MRASKTKFKVNIIKTVLRKLFIFIQVDQRNRLKRFLLWPKTCHFWLHTFKKP